MNAKTGAGTNSKPLLKRHFTITTGIAILAVIVSVGSWYFNHEQVVAATKQNMITEQQNMITKQQNIYAEQQELVTLVGSIAQVNATISQEDATFKNDSTALHEAIVGSQLTELANSEEAAQIIDLLRSNHVLVPAIEYYQAGVGLQQGQSDFEALNFLQDATNKSADPRTRANAWRAEAVMLYQLGRVSEAEQDMKFAEQAFNHEPDVTKEVYENNWAYTELLDAQYQAQVGNCTSARYEMNRARRILNRNPNAVSLTTTTQEKQDEGDLVGCRQSS